MLRLTTQALRETRLRNNLIRIIKLHGVNHHDTDPYKGWYETEDDLLRDLKLMKKMNINCIRTSHYPPTPKFLDMCDEMGFYVVLETDLETHGFLRRYANVPYEFDVDSGESQTSSTNFSDEFGKALCELAEKDKRKKLSELYYCYQGIFADINIISEGQMMYLDKLIEKMLNF